MRKIKLLAITVVALLVIIAVLSGCGEIIGKSAYELAVDNGFEGTIEEWLESLKAPIVEGKSAYQIALENGFEGTVTEWLDSLKGADGADGADGLDGSAAAAGKTAYEMAVDNGFVGSVSEWLESLKGADGRDGTDGRDGQNGVDSTLMSVSYASNKAILSAVTIYCEFNKSGSTSTSAGSGIIIEDDKDNGNAYIITNYHVVFDNAATPKVSDNIVLYLYAMQYPQYKIPASYVGGSLTYDVAVLKVENSDVYKNSAAIPADIRNNLTHYPGDTAIAVGNPQGNGLAVTTGIISVDSEQIDMTGADGITPVRFRVLRIDTAVNSGNSGGGLFNSAGQLIGMVNAKIMSTNVENIGYAIPLAVVINAYNNILRNCDGEDNVQIKRCLIGVEIKVHESWAQYDDETGKTSIIERIIVNSVSETGAAFGLLQAEDIIVAFTYGGVSYDVTRIHHLVDFSLNFVRYETLTLTIERGGVTMDVDVELINITDIA